MPISYADVVNSTPIPSLTAILETTRTAATASIQDPNSNPLHIHSADHAGISLVSEKLAGLSNFNTWRRYMLMALGARNKDVFVDGS